MSAPRRKGTPVSWAVRVGAASASRNSRGRLTSESRQKSPTPRSRRRRALIMARAHQFICRQSISHGDHSDLFRDASRRPSRTPYRTQTKAKRSGIVGIHDLARNHRQSAPGGTCACAAMGAAAFVRKRRSRRAAPLITHQASGGAADTKKKPALARHGRKGRGKLCASRP